MDDLKKTYIANASIDRIRYYFHDQFAFDSGLKNVWDHYTLDREIVEKTTHAYQLGDDFVTCPPGMREWGYTFFIPADRKDGNNNYAMGGFKTNPQTRAEALAEMKEILFRHYGIDKMKEWEACAGHYLWQHYSCEWGCTAVSAEVGESISSTQSHIAFCRGASRQYDVPWSLQFSFWQRGRINDYSGDAIWGERSKENGGHSASLYGRTALAAYMGGASHFYPEAGIVINFRKRVDQNGLYQLSPIGEMSRKLYDFVNRHRDIGIPFVPFGIVLDYYHGMFSGDRQITPKKVFRLFDYNAGDDMTFELLDRFFPDSWVTFDGEEATYQVNGPYGDTCDVLLQNAAQEVLNSYPCLILSGNITLTEQEEKRYTAYVKQGGTLILNHAYLHFFPEYEAQYNGFRRHTIPDGKGSVVIYGPNYCIGMLDGIIKEEIAKRIPFSLSETVEYSVNVKSNSLILTLINNDGYYYNHTNGEKIDMAGAKQINVCYTGMERVSGVTELLSDTTYKYQQGLLCNLAPGEVKIFEFSLKDPK